MRKISAFLALFMVFFAGCQSGPSGQMPPAEGEEGSGLVDQMMPYGAGVYRAVTHEGVCYKDHVAVYYLLQDDDGYPASDRKYGCVRLTDHPKGFSVGSSEYTYLPFDNGLITYRLNTTTPGTYVFEFCGIMDPPSGPIGSLKEYTDDKTYAGDGDPVEVEVPPYYFAVEEKKGEEKEGYLFVEYKLSSESGDYPGTDKRGCINLTSYPEGYKPVGTLIHPDFEENGVVKTKQPTYADVPGDYVFEFCGIYEYNENYTQLYVDDWLDDETYLGDGDAVTITINQSNVFEVYNGSCEVYGGPGTYGYECYWYMRFIDGSSGVCKKNPFMKDWKICYELEKGDKFYEGCWQPLNCYESSDSLKMRGSLSGGSDFTIWVDGAYGSDIVLQGDGYPIDIHTPSSE